MIRHLPGGYIESKQARDLGPFPWQFLNGNESGQKDCRHSNPLSSRSLTLCGARKDKLSTPQVGNSLLNGSLSSFTPACRAAKKARSGLPFPRQSPFHTPDGRPSKKTSVLPFQPAFCQSQSKQGLSIREGCSLLASDCGSICKATYQRGESFCSSFPRSTQSLRLPGNLARKHVANSKHAIETSAFVI